MRQVGTLPTAEAAERFAWHLKARKLECRVESSAAGATIWLYDEDALPSAQQDLERFQSGELQLAPVPPPPPAAVALRPVSRRRRLHDWWSFARFTPVTITLIVAAAAATLACDFGRALKPVGTALTMIPIVNKDSKTFRYLVRDDLGQMVSTGQVWRLVTPVLLHFSWLHLLLDLQWTRVFGGAIERTRGSWRLLGLVLISALASNVGQYLWSGPVFGGLSGVGHAMFGYIWMKHRFQPQAGLRVTPTLFWLFWGGFLLCFTDLLGMPIGNLAHAVGLASGILYGLIPVL